MSFACPCRKQSYVSFRLEIFKCLFASPSVPSQHTYPPVRRAKHEHGHHGHRAFQSSTKLSKRRGSRNFETDKELQAFMGVQLERDYPIATSTEESNTQTIADQDSTQDTSERTKPRPRSWTPYSERGQADLKDLIANLKETATKSVVFGDESHNRQARGARSVKLDLKDSPVDKRHSDQVWTAPGAKALNLPESPVLRRRPKEKLHKRLPTNEEVSKLSNNPWASILASPVRQCQATGVRLPRDLLVPWKIVKRPADGGTYLIPYNLAAVQNLRSVELDTMSTLKHEEEVKRKDESLNPSQPGTAIDGEVLAEKDALECEGIVEQEISQRNEGRHTTTNIVPYLPLIDHLTGKIIRKRIDGQKSSRTEIVKRLLSHRTKLAFKAAQHYAEQDGEKDMANLDYLRWQPDIAGRMTGIMRERILTALESLGQTDSRSLHRVPLKALKTGQMAVALSSDEGMTASHPQYRFKAAASMPESALEAAAREISEQITNMFAGSFLLHIDDFSTDGTRRQPPPVLCKWAPNLLPQSLGLNNTIQLPVFNLRQLMGFNRHNRDTTARRYRQILQSCSVLGPPSRQTEQTAHLESETESNTGNQHEVTSPYLVFVSSRAPMAPALARELWQLWRYVGGAGLETTGDGPS